jgi:NAD-dependent deacetylase
MSREDRNYLKVFMLTGAGVSAESGLGTFRDVGGLWSRFNIEEVASLAGYVRDPIKVLDFYNLRRANLVGAKPNAAHHAIARFEREWSHRGGQVFVCTQNIDDLHEQAGSRAVTHMHGELMKARCHTCGAVWLAEGDLTLALSCTSCGREGGVRPHVVWFGEEPLAMARIYDALLDADLFVSIGTSGAVYPAAGFVRAAREAGVATCELNLEPSDNADAFDTARYGPASEVVPAWVDKMLD